jgi:hypothetical protein
MYEMYVALASVCKPFFMQYVRRDGYSVRRVASCGAPSFPPQEYSSSQNKRRVGTRQTKGDRSPGLGTLVSVKQTTGCGSSNFFKHIWTREKNNHRCFKQTRSSNRFLFSSTPTILRLLCLHGQTSMCERTSGSHHSSIRRQRVASRFPRTSWRVQHVLFFDCKHKTQ